MQVLVDVMGNNGLIRTVPVSFDVTAHIKGLVAEKNIDAGSNPFALLEEREIEVTALNPSARPVAGQLPQSTANLRLRRGLQAGEVVKTTDLEPVPAVQRGDWITLRMTNGDIAMEGRAEVLQDGQLGQSVRVKLTGAERSILARVTGAGIVEILK
jgi:flagella basal body P-ring formation protein FlgA